MDLTHQPSITAEQLAQYERDGFLVLRQQFSDAELERLDRLLVHQDAVDQQIDLRRKIDDPFGRRAVETVRGFGYRLRSDGG